MYIRFLKPATETQAYIITHVQVKRGRGIVTSEWEEGRQVCRRPETQCSGTSEGRVVLALRERDVYSPGPARETKPEITSEMEAEISEGRRMRAR